MNYPGSRAMSLVTILFAMFNGKAAGRVRSWIILDAGILLKESSL